MQNRKYFLLDDMQTSDVPTLKSALIKRCRKAKTSGFVF